MNLPAPVVIVGASFSGLACAQALAERGVAATIIERKSESGDAAFNLLMRSSAMRAAASVVLFHRMRAR
ncbi:MAG: NAD-binding protein [Methylocystis sp.]